MGCSLKSAYTEIRKAHLSDSKDWSCKWSCCIPPNTGALLEIEVTAIPAKDKGSVNVTGIVEEESIGSQTKSIRRKSMAKGSVDNVLTVLRSLDVLPEGYDIHINFPGGIPIDNLLQESPLWQQVYILRCTHICK